MKVEKLQDGKIRIEFEIKEGDKLAEDLIERARDSSSPALNLSSVLRTARYDAGNDFRQPPEAWSPKVKHPSY